MHVVPPVDLPANDTRAVTAAVPPPVDGKRSVGDGAASVQPAAQPSLAGAAGAGHAEAATSPAVPVTPDKYLSEEEDAVGRDVVTTPLASGCAGAAVDLAVARSAPGEDRGARPSNTSTPAATTAAAVAGATAAAAASTGSKAAVERAASGNARTGQMPVVAGRAGGAWVTADGERVPLPPSPTVTVPPTAWPAGEALSVGLPPRTPGPSPRGGDPDRAHAWAAATADLVPTSDSDTGGVSAVLTSTARGHKRLRPVGGRDSPPPQALPPARGRGDAGKAGAQPPAGALAAAPASTPMEVVPASAPGQPPAETKQRAGTGGALAAHAEPMPPTVSDAGRHE
ncbi:hypothetical protein I4F81_006797 [Pyropia yezoensis]|uniref:Uncharacterized protein n=1 Tax=Pyropia yezoensis TaxID=2788 RepID=A0ACC3C2C2_PYRYE|nr:hypothetical protein I4F81_006797 [Neopyropia yezoensis]